MLERARHAVEDYLAHFPPARRQAILRGPLVSVLGKENDGSDTAIWLTGAGDEQDSMRPGMGLSSVASLTIEALRGIGLLDDLIPTTEGSVIYSTDLHNRV